MLRGLGRYFICEFRGQNECCVAAVVVSFHVFVLFGASESTFKNTVTM